MNLHINLKRLRALLGGVNGFGRNPKTGGFNRIGFCDADMAARRWLCDEMRQDGLSVTSDGVANIFGRYGQREGPCIMAGSHLDTVPEGGAFDGALGVCVALECVRTMKEAGIKPPVPIEVAAFSEEEGRFGGMLGSQALSGAVEQEWLESASDADGISLTEAMAAQGLKAQDALKCARPAGSILAFLELHIEQGPVLEAGNLPVGIVNAVSGVSNLQVRFQGKANHSGTTPMALRADAFAGLAQFGASIPHIIEKAGSGRSTMTIGKVELGPNFPHTIPGMAEFSIITRDTDERKMRAMLDALRQEMAHVCKAHRLEFSIAEKSWLPPTALDKGLVDMLRGEAAKLGLENTVMHSGAGHDAQTMQSLCPSVLIFVPSRGGVSHAPDEWSDWQDIENGAQLMLGGLLKLSGALGE